MKKIFLIEILLISISQLNAQTLDLEKDINPGTANSNISFENVGFLQDMMFFAAQNTEVGREVFMVKHDSVLLLKDISPGPGGSNPQGFFNFKNELYFFDSHNNALEIWKTDGTEEGTTMAIAFMGSTFNYNDVFIVSRDDHFYFTRNDRIYVSDGTQSGTYEIPESPGVTFEESFGFTTLNVDRFEDGIAFVIDQDTAFQLFNAHDSTINLLGTINVSSQESFSVLGPFEVNAGLVVAVRNGTGSVGDLYLYNKTTGLLEKYSDTNIVATRIKRISDSRLLVTTDESSCYATSGTTAGTNKILSTSAQPASWEPLPFVRIGDAAIFHGGEPFMADLVNATNGTPPGTRLVKNIPGNGLSNFVSKANYAFWVNDHFFNGTPQVWYADINGSGATLLYEHPSVFNDFTYEINPIGVTNNKIYFVAKLDDIVGKELYSLEHHLNVSTNTQNMGATLNCQIIHDRAQASFKAIMDGNNIKIRVEIYDILGRLISSVYTFENEWINLPAPQGTYAISIQTNEGHYSKLIIQ